VLLVRAAGRERHALEGDRPEPGRNSPARHLATVDFPQRTRRRCEGLALPQVKLTSSTATSRCPADGEGNVQPSAASRIRAVPGGRREARRLGLVHRRALSTAHPAVTRQVLAGCAPGLAAVPSSPRCPPRRRCLLAGAILAVPSRRCPIGGRSGSGTEALPGTSSLRNDTGMERQPPGTWARSGNVPGIVTGMWSRRRGPRPPRAGEGVRMKRGGRGRRRHGPSRRAVRCT